MSYPYSNYLIQDEISCARMEALMERVYREAAEKERDAALSEAKHWKANHDNVVALKRRLSVKYGRLVRWTPYGIRRRIIKRVRKLTHRRGRNA